jgi:hypothetical protein
MRLRSASIWDLLSAASSVISENSKSACDLKGCHGFLSIGICWASRETQNLSKVWKRVGQPEQGWYLVLNPLGGCMDAAGTDR